MILNISTTYQPATDLGYLLHKHPDKFQTLELSVGKAHIFYPEKSHERTTVSVLLDIDPIDMIRGARNLGGDGFALGHYVNDRPYVASSFMSVALSKAFSSAMNGKCKDKPELVDVKFPFEVTIAVIPAPKGGLSLNISEKDNSLDLELALSVAEYFRVDKKQAKKIIDTIKSTVSGWRGLAKKVGISKAE